MLKYREPVVENSVESADQWGIIAQGGRRTGNPGANERICSKGTIPLTGGDHHSAITIRFSPTTSSAP